MKLSPQPAGLAFIGKIRYAFSCVTCLPAQPYESHVLAASTSLSGDERSLFLVHKILEDPSVLKTEEKISEVSETMLAWNACLLLTN